MKNQSFAREFAKLNPEQRLTVETIEGPVMVLAGPGTGKTQVVAMRIGQILSKTHTSPRNILALTFTEAGVTALRQRLIDIIGPDAYQVTVSTFHGFANEVIGIFPYAFELPATTSNIDELETYQIVDKIVRVLPGLDLLRPARVPNHHVGAIIAAIKTLKQEAVAPEQLQKLALSVIKTQPKKATKASIEATRRQADILQELTLVYGAYQKYLLEERLYDYEDMVLFVNQSFSKSPEIKQYLQERYQYILVDEYQDTNNAQNDLVEALADFFEKPNLFVVGDDKQAIYRFQGASVANMLHFAAKYPDIKVISLKTNYRNPKLVIDCATKLISNNGQQLSSYLDIKTNLISASKLVSPPRLITFATHEAQYSGIVEHCKKRLHSGQDANQIAVLFRSNIEAQEFRDVAWTLGLSVAGAQSADLLGEPIIRGLLNILRAVNEPTNSYRVLAALPYLELDVTAIEISEALKGRKTNRSLIDDLTAQRRLPGVSNAASSLRELVVKQKSTNLLDLLLVIVGKCALTTDKDNDRKIDQLEIIHAFLDKAKQLISRRPSLNVKGLVEYFDLLQEYHIAISVRRASPEIHGVHVSTVHGAKGLEFETVVMANVAADSWKVRASRSVIKLPSQIAEVKKWKEDQLEDERRLFYVGMTRAKKELVLTLSKTKADGSETLPSQFITEIEDLLKKENVDLKTETTKKLLEDLLLPVSTATLTERQNLYIKEKISGSPFSYTHYRSYLTCPRRYLLRNVLHLPEPPSFALQYGSAVHKAFELYFKQYVQTKMKPGKDYLIQYFVEAIKRELAGTELKQTIKKGSDLLGGYFEQKSTSWLMPVGVEYSFYTHRTELEGIWLTGKFDRIDPIDPIARTVRVIDYKTGSKPKTRGQILGTTKDSDGEVKQQLVFYALLAKHDQIFPFNVREFVISSVDDAGKFTDEAFTISPEDILVLEKSIIATYQEILARKDFPHLGGSYERGCELCALF
ncbi:MAG: ATP-dependent helicase [Candidatus Berkelbacteria bacterium]|nr:ATP-dependent helicase [Candidatus Berkelbacteria bacterium]MCR4307687.1 ATP-dependent helicase [Candidatus Berkelbacteria bacterium]